MTKRPVVQRKGELPRKYLPQSINILKKLCKLVFLQCYIFFFLYYLGEGGGNHCSSDASLKWRAAILSMSSRLRDQTHVLKSYVENKTEKTVNS